MNKNISKFINIQMIFVAIFVLILFVGCGSDSNISQNIDDNKHTESLVEQELSDMVESDHIVSRPISDMQSKAISNRKYEAYKMQESGVAPIVMYNEVNPKQYFNTDSFDFIKENGFREVATSPLSTFGADVDTASYALVKNALESGNYPNVGAVRIEELLNSFDYSYKAPKNEPLAVYVDMADAMWNAKHKVMRVALQAKKIDWEKRPASNLVFLIDTSGSMQGDNRLPLVIESIKMLTQKLDSRDRVSIVTYAGDSRVLLESTNDKSKILQAIDTLNAAGSTQGSAGIRTAYEIASKNCIKGGVNRIILATDGDFNVGITSQDELISLIKDKAKSGIYLSIFGFGMGNYKDSMLFKLADSGNGNYGYINNVLEAKRQFVERINATLITIAKDVKIQVEFNPAKVASYRLIGYEKRNLANEDFNDDSKDSGEIGVGHSVTALYEIIPIGINDDDLLSAESSEESKVDTLKYSKNVLNEGYQDEWASVKVRYKEPKNEAHNDEKSILIQTALKGIDNNASADMRFVQCVAAFGMLLSDSPFKGDANFKQILDTLSDKEVSNDIDKQEFIGLVVKASKIK